MQIGFCSQFTEEHINLAAEEGLAAMELEGSRQWSHLVQATPEQFEARAALLKEKNVRVGGIICAYNYLSEDKSIAKDAQSEFDNLLNLCVRLGGDLITTVTGLDETLSLDDNIKKMVDVFGPMVDKAASKGVKVAFENCPGHATFATTIENMEKIYTALDSPNFGLELDPSHFVWQGIDYLDAARIFASKILRVHAKDTEVFDDKFKRCGIYGQGWWVYRLPGCGSVDWPKFFQILREGRFDGLVMIEHEDPFFGHDRYLEGIRIAKRYLSQFVW